MFLATTDSTKWAKCCAVSALKKCHMQGWLQSVKEYPVLPESLTSAKS